MDETQNTEKHQPIRLTKTVQKGGCAAKVAATELRQILSSVRFPAAPPELLVDGRHFDDAAIYKISDTVAMVQTIDFFTPILDTPRTFGRVAAVNALSDVYAMGGKPVTALGVLAFPLMTLPGEVITEVMQGACDAIAEAGAALAGGHSIDDDTLKFGLSVTGLVHPDRVWSNTGAREGDVLILTKGLGTGTLTAGLKRDAFSEDDIRAAITSMGTLNNAIDYLTPKTTGEADTLEDLAPFVHAATDITGFGLSGHAMQMAVASGVNFEIDMRQVPRLEGAEESLKREFLTKAHRTNREYTASFVDASALSPIEQLLLHDPQTSGGLLLSVAREKADAILARLKPAFTFSAVIGQVNKFDGPRIIAR
jgi:selenide,water dikinase